MRERDVGRLGRQRAHCDHQRLRLLGRDPPLGARSERRRAEPEEAVLLALQPLAEPAGRLLHPAELLEPAGELLRRLLRIEVAELDLLVREQLSCLQLEERPDQHEELPAGVQVERLAVGERRRQRRRSPGEGTGSAGVEGEALDERDDDVGDVHVPRLQLLPQDERQQQVERALERVEVELELPDMHRGEASGAGGRGPLRVVLNFISCGLVFARRIITVSAGGGAGGGRFARAAARGGA